MNVLSSSRDFRNLSAKDLLEARNHYHVHLLNKENVVGTAIGSYLIRTSEPWPSKSKPKEDLERKPKSPRTFANSEKRPYSWPCVLVLVDKWVDYGDLPKKLTPQDVVPRTLYLPDGRVVPVCVVHVEPVEAAPAKPKWMWPTSRIGGGFPLVVHAQGEERRASVGCLVTDGHTLYALTSRHVCGPEGTAVYTQLRGSRVEIGSSATRQITRLPFSDVYPEFPCRRSFLNLDVGVVAVADARDWTSRTYGLGEVGRLADLNEFNIGVQLIDQPVRAFGAASGLIDGKIKALFYRYQSIGGYDYVSDLMIAPTGGTQTLQGDSGTVWHLVTDAGAAGAKGALRPLAIEWGAQSITGNGGVFNFALATNLSNVLRLLDVELVAEHNTGVRPYWGATGHYSIGTVAIGLVTDTRLKSLLKANLSRISVDRASLEQGDIGQVLRDAAFIPLADVPDFIWKKTAAEVAGGRDPRPHAGPEHPVHYADIDEARPGGATLLKLCLQDPNNVAVDVWRTFYDDTGHTKSKERGLLPFRVWQFYDAMVQYAKQKKYAEFVAAAGTLAHYVGDACQILHGSILADGYSDQAVEGVTSGGKKKFDWPAKGIHSAYETKMLDEKADELFVKIDQALNNQWPALVPIATGHDAAVATIRLMSEVSKVIRPAALCDKYIELGEGASKAVIDGLWKKFGTKTAKNMANGCRVLAHIWQSAWVNGGGKNAAAGAMKQFTEAKIRKIYEDTKFVESLDLDDIGPVLK